jgi:hypothetical protein
MAQRQAETAALFLPGACKDSSRICRGAALPQVLGVCFCWLQTGVEDLSKTEQGVGSLIPQSQIPETHLILE